MLTWDQLSEVEQLRCEYSDFYKDVYGFRPYWNVEQMNSVEWLKAALAELGPIAERVFAREREEENDRVVAFENRVKDVILLGAGNRESAIRWIRESLNDANVLNDEHFKWSLGLPYSYKL